MMAYKGSTCWGLGPIERPKRKAEDLMRWECADSIRARDDEISHPKAGYMEAIFFLSRSNFFLASRGEPYMTP